MLIVIIMNVIGKCATVSLVYAWTIIQYTYNIMFICVPWIHFHCLSSLIAQLVVSQEYLA